MKSMIFKMRQCNISLAKYFTSFQINFDLFEKINRILARINIP